MALNDVEAQNQIRQMINFILNEAKDKAEEIESKALEEFNIKKLTIVQRLKEETRQKNIKQIKLEETKIELKKSKVLLELRLECIKTKNDILNNIKEAAGAKLETLHQNRETYKNLIVDLIVESCVRLATSNALVYCKSRDRSILPECIKEAKEKYERLIKSKPTHPQEIEIILEAKDLESFSPTGASCLGGVILTTADGLLICDNTLRARLDNIVDKMVPLLSSKLYGKESKLEQ